MMETFDYTKIEEAAETIIRRDLLCERLQKLAKKEPKILEVGIGAGEMTTMVLENYGSITVVDNDRKVCDHLLKNIKVRNLPDIDLIFGSIEDVELGNSAYDNILLMNTLEHIKDPTQVLKKLALSLSTDGRMHITVNLAHSFHRLLGVKLGVISNIEELSESDIEFGHYRVYTPDLLRKHVWNASLHVVYEQFMYLKPFPSSMLHSLSMNIHRGLDSLGRDFPEFASYIYIEISKDVEVIKRKH